MIFPYLYTDMSRKQILIVSMLLLNVLSARALAPDGDVLSGDTILFDDGSWYTGQVADSLFNGYGKMVYADSTVYEGEWKNGLWNGKGKLFYPDGDSYEGEFMEHEFSGYGVYLYADGAKYDGYWENGMFNGAGTMNYADGSTYSGSWKDDMKDGLGFLYDNQAGVLYKGHFENDSYVSPISSNYHENIYGTFESVSDYDFDGFFYEPPRRPDTLFHSKGDMMAGITAGTRHMFSFHFDYYVTNRFFAGARIGLDPNDHTVGESSEAVDDETGEQISLVGWNSYVDEIMSEKEYTNFRIAGECGLSWGWFSLGMNLGIGLRHTIRNCKSLEHNDSYFEPGTLYYRDRITGAKFDYGVFTDIVLSRSIPVFHSCSLRTGYGSLDGFFIGMSVIF